MNPPRQDSFVTLLFLKSDFYKFLHNKYWHFDRVVPSLSTRRTISVWIKFYNREDEWLNDRHVRTSSLLKRQQLSTSILLPPSWKWLLSWNRFRVTITTPGENFSLYETFLWVTNPTYLRLSWPPSLRRYSLNNSHENPPSTFSLSTILFLCPFFKCSYTKEDLSGLVCPSIPSQVTRCPRLGVGRGLRSPTRKICACTVRRRTGPLYPYWGSMETPLRRSQRVLIGILFQRPYSVIVFTFHPCVWIISLGSSRFTQGSW